MNLALRFNLRDKILLGFGVTLVILLIIFFVSLVSLLRLGRASEAILKQNYMSIEAVNEMRDAVGQLYLLQISGSNPAMQEEKINQQLRFDRWLTVEKGNITERGEKEAVKQLEQAYRSLLLDMERHKNIAFVSESNVLPMQEEVNRVRSGCDKILDINQHSMFAASNRAKLIAHKATYTLILAGLLGILLSVIFSLSLSSLIVRPLKAMLQALERVANGDYTARIPYHTKDELGIVSSEFNHMAEKLSEYNEVNIRSILTEKQINEAILQNMDDGLFLLDMSYRITNVNTSGARFFGKQVEQCLHKHILEVVRDEHLFEFIQQTAKEGKSPAFKEGENLLVVAIEKEKEKQYLQFYLTPVFLQSGEPLGVMILFQDITHLKQLDKLKSEFLMIASHELKTPLTSINMSIALLQETALSKLNEQEKELLDIASQDTQRLKALISDLLDISKIEAGKIDMQFETVSAESILSKAVQSFSAQAQDKHISLQSSAPDSLMVKCDFGKIAWVMTNLISNALRFTPAQGSIDIKAVQMGSFAQFSVSDTGIGIPLEHQNKIFDKFYQVASPLNTGGTGLGLSICREIIRAHGGTIWVESEQDKGSTFYFTLPLG